MDKLMTFTEQTEREVFEFVKVCQEYVMLHGLWSFLKIQIYFKRVCVVLTIISPFYDNIYTPSLSVNIMMFFCW